MYRRNKPSRPQLLALRRYIGTMEQGDVETVAAILQEAGQDRVLEHMILELNSISQEIDRSVVSAQEAHEVSQHLLTPLLDQQRRRLALSNSADAPHDHYCNEDGLLCAVSHTLRLW